jgi:hypothetical protein
VNLFAIEAQAGDSELHRLQCTRCQ